jgi:hypothetical protein
LAALTYRISLEIKKENSFLIPEKIFHVFQAISESNKFVVPFGDMIEAELSNLFVFLGDSGNLWKYEESLYTMWAKIVKIRRVISSNCLQLISNSGNVFERNNHQLGFLYNSINMFCIFGQESLKGQPEIIGLFINLGLSALRNREKVENIEEVQNEGAHLLQCILECFYSSLSFETFQTILRETAMRLWSHDNPINKSHLLRGLIGIFLMGFLVAVEPTTAILKEMNQVSGFFDVFFKANASLCGSYERKLFILALSNMIFCNDGTFNPWLDKMVKRAVLLLKIQEICEKSSMEDRRETKSLLEDQIKANLLLGKDFIETQQSKASEEEKKVFVSFLPKKIKEENLSEDSDEEEKEAPLKVGDQDIEKLPSPEVASLFFFFIVS